MQGLTQIPSRDGISHERDTKQEAWINHRHIVALVRGTSEAFLLLGAVLDGFVRERQYIDLGHPSFKSYCNDPDVELSHTTAWRYCCP